MRSKAVLTGLSLIAAVIILGWHNSPAAEKLKLGSSTKTSPWYYLPIFGAEEGGFWKENGLEAEWVPFRSGTEHHQAVAARSINIGFTSGTAQIQSMARGLPALIIMQVRSRDDFFIYVRGQSPWREPKELKGARVGVSRFGGAEHAFGRAALKVLGLEAEVKFLSSGGITESLAGLKTGTIDAVILTPAQMLPLIMSGEVRVLMSIYDHLPKPWISSVLLAHKDYIKSNPDTVRRAVRAIVKGIDYVEKNPAWAMKKMKEVGRYTDEEAKYMFEQLELVKGGLVNRKGLENVRNFLLEYGILARDKAPAVDEMFTNEFNT